MATLSDLKSLAKHLFEAAVAAADPAAAVTQALRANPLPQPAGTLFVIAIGKAAPAMMSACLAQARGAAEALVVTHHENGADVPGATVMRAGHPVPDAAGLAAAGAIEALLAKAGPDDAVVALISGGGSALVPAPLPGMSLKDKADVNRLLLGAGLDITQMNLVRQNLSRLKGGGFLRQAAPAPVSAYLLSDVIGDDLRVIASGPTVSPIGSAAEAEALIRAHGLWDDLPERARDALQTAPTPAPLPDVRNVLVGSNRQSLQAMLDAAQARGWDAEIVDDSLEGDVAEAAARVLREMGPCARPVVKLFGGETTVVLKGNGRGGRNQEMALRVALGGTTRAQDWVFLSGGTDGRDGPTDAAGGVVDGNTAARIRAAGGDVSALLENNDSYAALRLAGDLLVTEATGTNVADVQALVLMPG